jgi:hypothetical protein
VERASSLPRQAYKMNCEVEKLVLSRPETRGTYTQQSAARTKTEQKGESSMRKACEKTKTKDNTSEHCVKKDDKSAQQNTNKATNKSDK